jgi:AhpD family alkylhydroperoxidase
MTDYLANERSLHAETKALSKATPEVSQAFGGLVRSVNETGALDHKQKELIALGIAICIRCEGCLLFHTRALIKDGCTREEFATAVSVAVEMGGGPARVYGSHALAIFDQMSAG